MSHKNTAIDKRKESPRQSCHRNMTIKMIYLQWPIFEVEDEDSDEDVTSEAEGTRRENVDRNKVPDYYPHGITAIGSQGRFYNHDRWAWKRQIPDVKKSSTRISRTEKGTVEILERQIYAEEIDTRGQMSVTRYGRPNEKEKKPNETAEENSE
ncbi:Hypothetical predicted protein [Mytilus galloprovincialis]|uniref:Uncharacterized protein n=1 Tax=Mytilus galloprovincialis TaxID=29158 RepID=A0A8B6EFH7_MYTGA|nr:Hypothetical predicted protein [Mytilus galloprovincialis]